MKKPTLAWAVKHKDDYLLSIYKSRIHAQEDARFYGGSKVVRVEIKEVKRKK